ncbi:MAG: CPBP family glutamic-type intramembrane protease [Nitrososphaeria archaeon]
MTYNDMTVERRTPFWKYVIGLLVIMFGTYSQYVFEIRGLAYGTMIVYVIPAAVIYLLNGKTILSKAHKNIRSALEYGLGYFGVFTAAGIAFAFLLLAVLFAFDPKTSELLNKPNPLFEISPGLAWFMLLFSFAIVGPFEEFMFRGFIFGELQKIWRSQHWFLPALTSSLIFSIIHLYYFFLFGIASVIQFTQIIMFGLGMCGAYFKSGGNLVVPALIHGAFDATSFLVIAIPQNPFVGLQLKVTLILVSVLVGIFKVIGKP